jgi:dienelactone hydrolase
LLLGWRLLGAQEHGIPLDDVHKLEPALKQLGKTTAAETYDDAGHPFENPNN